MYGIAIYKVLKIRKRIFLTSLLASLFLDWLLWINPSAYRLLIRVLREKLIIIGVKEIALKKSRLEYASDLKWPEVQSSRSPRYRGVRTPGPAARNPAPHPEKQSSKRNYFKPFNSQKIKVAETICFVWQQIDYRRGKLKDKMTGEYKRAQKRVSATSRPDWRKTASCSSADFLCLTDLPSSLNFVFVCYSTPSPPTFKCPPIFWNLNEVSKQAGKMYVSLQYLFDIHRRGVGFLGGF